MGLFMLLWEHSKWTKDSNSEYCGRIFVNPSLTVFSFISEYQMISIAFIGIRNQVGVIRLETWYRNISMAYE